MMTEYIRAARGFPIHWGPWHVLVEGVDGYARQWWKYEARCGAYPHVHGRSQNTVTEIEPPADEKRCASCFRALRVQALANRGME